MLGPSNDVTIIRRLAAFSRVTLSALAMSCAANPCHAEISVDGLYDFRHLTAPGINTNDLPVVEFKAFIPQGVGAFLMKEEKDFDGPNHNVSQIYTELSQSIKMGNVTLGGAPVFAR